jgi:hypothetical protein
MTMMNTDFFDNPSMPTGYGGARPRAGRKKAEDKAKAQPGEEETPYQRFERARADKEVSLARQAEVKANLEEGVVVYREAVQSGAAKAFAMCSQSLDAIADNLERQLGVAPEIAEKVAKYINEAKAQLAEDLQRLGSTGQESQNDDLFS